MKSHSLQPQTTFLINKNKFSAIESTDQHLLISPSYQLQNLLFTDQPPLSWPLAFRNNLSLRACAPTCRGSILAFPPFVRTRLGVLSLKGVRMQNDVLFVFISNSFHFKQKRGPERAPTSVKNQSNTSRSIQKFASFSGRGEKMFIFEHSNNIPCTRQLCCRTSSGRQQRSLDCPLKQSVKQCEFA